MLVIFVNYKTFYFWWVGSSERGKCDVSGLDGIKDESDGRRGLIDRTESEGLHVGDSAELMSKLQLDPLNCGLY